MKKAEIRVTIAAGAGTGTVRPVMRVPLEKIIIVVPAGVTTDVSFAIHSDITEVGDEVVYAKTGLAAGTYHIYPRTPVTNPSGTAVTGVTHAKMIVEQNSALKLTLANATGSGTVALYALFCME